MYDVIIVGARVAGAATAMLLARRGLKVLAVDRARFPSDTLSTHQLQVPAVTRLGRWGLLDEVMAAGTPATRQLQMNTPDAVFTGRLADQPGPGFVCGPRRTLLDELLVRAAVRAGAEVREGVVVQHLTRDDGDRVTGIRGQHKGGTEFTETAAIVIGADGKHSLVARDGQAGSYRTHQPVTMACYTYWADLAMTGAELYSRPGLAIGLWPTNDDLVMSYLAWPVSRFAKFRADVDGTVRAAFESVGLGERLAAARRAERYRSTPDLPAWFRRPYGPGWALVGDAGLVLDPLTGYGISDAFRDAELLADAVVAGLGGGQPMPKAMAGYQGARDAAAGPMYDFTAQLARLAAPGPGELRLFHAVAAEQRHADRFVGALTGAIPLPEFMSPKNVIGLVGVRGFAALIADRLRRPASTGDLDPAAGAMPEPTPDAPQTAAPRPDGPTTAVWD